MLARQSFQAYSCLTFRRSISLSRHSSFNWRKIWYAVEDLLTGKEKYNFDEEEVRRAHKYDRISTNEWLLIYRDRGAIRSFMLVAIAIPFFLIVLTGMVYDVCRNKPQDRHKVVQHLLGDFEEIGILAIVPVTAFFITISIILRFHKLRLMRIYQNRVDGNKYVAVGSKGLIWKQQIYFDRNSALAYYIPYEPEQSIKRIMQILAGNMQIEKQRFLISDEGFRANNYQSYMLGETSTMPKL